MKSISFKGPMIQALLDGRKTVTRRLVKPQPVMDADGMWQYRDDTQWMDGGLGMPQSAIEDYAPYQPGDILYVQETWYYEMHMHDLTDGEADLPSGGLSLRYVYRASSPDYPVGVGVGEQGWHSAKHMPTEAARLFLRVTSVGIERVQEITEKQAEAEGIGSHWAEPHRDTPLPEEALCRTRLKAFAQIWDDCYAQPRLVRRKGEPPHYASYPWEDTRETRIHNGLPWRINGNPWVWVTEFELISKEEAVS